MRHFPELESFLVLAIAVSQIINVFHYYHIVTVHVSWLTVC